MGHRRIHPTAGLRGGSAPVRDGGRRSRPASVRWNAMSCHGVGQIRALAAGAAILVAGVMLLTGMSRVGLGGSG